jgi:hypothetical protein
MVFSTFALSNFLPMKKIVWIMMAGIIITSCRQNDQKEQANVAGTNATDSAAAQNTASNTDLNPTPDSANLTRVEWLDKQEKDYGKIKEGQNLEVSFKFKNTGSRPLVISKVWAQCGCTVPETPQKPYAPGEEGVIKATFNSSGKLGMNTKEVYMQANTSPATSVMVFHVEVSPTSKN